jgi:hypothetical protein
MATVLTLGVYLGTLTPDLGLRNDGCAATSAMYGGVAWPTGFPVWTILGWAFAKALPIGTIGWRVALASAMAGALACGVIALMVSRGGAESAGEFPYAEIIRVAGGASAGLVFGMNAALWRQAVVPDPWSMTNLMVCGVICLLMRWGARPEERRFLFGAALLYGLTLTNSLIALSIAPAIPFFVLIFDRQLGRHLLFLGAVLYVLTLCGFTFGVLQNVVAESERPALHLIGVTATILAIGSRLGCRKKSTRICLFIPYESASKTRRLLTACRGVLLCLLLVFFGTFAWVYLPITGMTNPPMNWGYPRTPEGFFHVLTRGQYDKIMMTEDLPRYLGQVWLYAQWSAQDFGWPCLVVAGAPFFFWRQMDTFARKRLIGLVVVYVFLAFLVIAVLNPTPELQTGNLVRMYYSPSYIVLAVLMGHGLILTGRRFILARKGEDGVSNGEARAV